MWTRAVGGSYFVQPTAAGHAASQWQRGSWGRCECDVGFHSADCSLQVCPSYKGQVLQLLFSLLFSLQCSLLFCSHCCWCSYGSVHCSCCSHCCSVLTAVGALMVLFTAPAVLTAVVMVLFSALFHSCCSSLTTRVLQTVHPDPCALPRHCALSHHCSLSCHCALARYCAN